MAHLAGKRIAIAGAGVGGSAFAIALEEACMARGISPLPIIKLFERDASPSARENLGYSFSLTGDRPNEPAGLQVLRNLGRGIIEELKQVQEVSNEGHICFQKLQPLLTQSSTHNISRPDEGGKDALEVLRIMRTRLRQAILSKVPSSSLSFGKVCTSATETADSEQPIKLTFADGTTEECDMLVVADGANSKLRDSLLPHEKPSYTGICMLMGRTEPYSQLPPAFQQGHYLVFGRQAKALFMGGVDRNTVMWSLSRKVPKEEVDRIQALLKDPASAQDFMDKEVPKLANVFPDQLFSLIAQTKASSLAAIPAIEKLPHPVHSGRVVYIGDAWHPMSPFAGAGANMALLDAQQLAQQLVNGGHNSMQAAIKEFAAKEAQRSVEAIKGARRLIYFAHTDGWRKHLIFVILWTAGSIFRLIGAAKSLFWGSTSKEPLLSKQARKSRETLRTHTS